MGRMEKEAIEKRLKIKKVFSCIQKLKSSANNKYCLFCRTEIVKNNHICKEVEQFSDMMVQLCLQLDRDTNKKIMEELNCELLRNQDFACNIKNKIIAYNL